MYALIVSGKIVAHIASAAFAQKMRDAWRAQGRSAHFRKLNARDQSIKLRICKASQCK